MTQLVINLKNVSIRPFHPNDAEQQYGIVSDRRVAQTLLQLPSMELAETERWATEEKPGRHRLVAIENDRLLGAIHITQYLRSRLMHSGRLGMMVHPDAWGQGVGSKLVGAALDIADNWLNLSRVELEVFTHNTAAVRLYERFGFEQEGTRKKVAFGNGRFLDDLIMARLHGPKPGAEQISPQPKPLPQADFSPDEVIIRPIRHDDIEDLHDCFRHPLVARTTLQMPSQEIGATQKRVDTTVQGLHRFVAEVEGKVIGSISLRQPANPRMAHVGGLGMMVHPAYWGKGVGGQLMATVIDLADNWLNISRIELEVNVDNAAGIRLYRRFGFEVEGTKRWHAFGDGRLADSHFMTRVR